MRFSPKQLSVSVYSKFPRVVQEGIARAFLFFPSKIKFGSGYVFIQKLLKKTRDLNKEQIMDFQFQCFLDVYRHAITSIPFYKRYYGDHGLDENSIKSPEDIAKIPPISKDMVRENLQDFVWPSFPPKKIRKSTTGGTTGQPLSMYMSRLSPQIQWGFNRDILNRVGYEPKDVRFVFSRIPYLRARSGIKQFFHPKFNALFLDLDYLNKETAGRYIDIFRKTNPKFIMGYASVVFIFAQFIKEQNKPIPKLKGILPHSQKLLSGQREMMEEVFGGKVFTHYSMAEKVILAAECAYSRDYHIVPEFGYAELLDSGGQVIKAPNTEGELVGTGFYNKVMPLIRYRTSDIAAFREDQNCPCGRPHKILTELIGRKQEFIVRKDGSLKGITAGAHAFFIFAEFCRGFQLYQEVPGKIEVRIVPKSDNPPGYLERIRVELKNKYFGPMDFDIVLRDSLEGTKSGKHMYLIQKLKTPAESKENEE
jgi:phenylacetate-CoA ligase